MYLMRGILLLLTVVVYASALFGQQVKIDSVNIYFDHDKSQLNPNEQAKLKLFIDNCREYDQTDIKIEGFCDHLGSQEYNQDLSEKRALIVYSFLLNKGLDHRMVKWYIGKGKLRKPSEVTEEQKIPKDRRVTIYSKRQMVEEDVPSSLLDSFDIDEVKVGETIKLKNVNFYGGRHIPLPSSTPEFKKLFEIMVKYPNLKIEIQGHICCLADGSDGLDFDTRRHDLSTARAKFVYTYLIKHGIDPNRLEYKGYARQFPIYEEEDTEWKKNPKQKGRDQGDREIIRK